MMDAKEFGKFIAELRKEKQMTQSELAKQLNVTDKAVSRWERGLGFPDINTLEPLAEALGISLAELMKCKKLSGSEVEVREAAEMICSGIDIAKYQRREYRRKLVRSIILCMLGILLIAAAFYIRYIPISVGIIGGADGPTSIWVAGKISSSRVTWVGVFGAILTAIGIFGLIRMRKDR